MPGGRPSERDRWVVVACAGVALLFAVGVPLFGTAYVTQGAGLPAILLVRMLLAQVPLCAALAALVLTRIPGVGLGIAATAAVVGGVVGVVAFLGVAGRGSGVSFALAPVDVVGWLAWAVVAALALLPAELFARRLSGFTGVTGALTGLGTGLAAVVLDVLPLLVHPSRLSALPASYWAGTLLAPTVLLTVVGAVAGVVAASSRPQPGWGPGTP